MRREYLPELARVRAQREATLQKQKEDSTTRMLADLAVDRARNPRNARQDRWNPHEEGDEEEDEEDGGELNIIDRSAFHTLSSSAIVLFPSAFRITLCPAFPSRGISGGVLYDKGRRGLNVRCNPFWPPSTHSGADLITSCVIGSSLSGDGGGGGCQFPFVDAVSPSFSLFRTALHTVGRSTNAALLGEDPWPGQYVDLTQARRREDSDMAWPRPT